MDDGEDILALTLTAVELQPPHIPVSAAVDLCPGRRGHAGTPSMAFLAAGSATRGLKDVCNVWLISRVKRASILA